MVATHRQGFDPCLAHLMMLSNEKRVSEAYFKKNVRHADSSSLRGLNNGWDPMVTT
jgi:hypothetical protein